MSLYDPVVSCDGKAIALGKGIRVRRGRKGTGENRLGGAVEFVAVRNCSAGRAIAIIDNG